MWHQPGDIFFFPTNVFELSYNSLQTTDEHRLKLSSLLYR